MSEVPRLGKLRGWLEAYACELREAARRRSIAVDEDRRRPVRLGNRLDGRELKLLDDVLQPLSLAGRTGACEEQVPRQAWDRKQRRWGACEAALARVELDVA
jgi:hypothetical protein